MTLLAAVKQLYSRYGMRPTYWVAYSGGLDSHVLLSLCHALRAEHGVVLRAVHVNHGLSPHANQWTKHCAKVCKQYDIDFLDHAIQIDTSHGESLEEAAREQRYAFFASCLKEGDLLLTAHQQDDQAETVLLQLLRGAGLKGLAAMPVVKPLSAGLHVRPLLTFSRADLERYAKEQSLTWIEDESNTNRAFTRNFIRHDILALLKQRWPTVSETMTKSAGYCAEAQVLLDEFGVQEWKYAKGGRWSTLSIAKLLQLNPAKQRLVLRTWIHHLGFSVPDAKKMETIRTNVFLAGENRAPCVTWKQTCIRRYRDDLYVMPHLPPVEMQSAYTWNLQTMLPLSSIGVLQAVPVIGRGLSSKFTQVEVRFRQGKEVMHIKKRGHQTLKNLFQENGVPPWERDRIPFIYVENQLAMVVGYFLDDDFAAKENEAGFEFLINPAV